MASIFAPASSCPASVSTSTGRSGAAYHAFVPLKVVVASPLLVWTTTLRRRGMAVL